MANLLASLERAPGFPITYRVLAAATPIWDGTGVPNADIVVSDMAGTKLCSIQVKTR